MELLQFQLDDYLEEQRGNLIIFQAAKSIPDFIPLTTTQKKSLKNTFELCEHIVTSELWFLNGMNNHSFKNVRHERLSANDSIAKLIEIYQKEVQLKLEIVKKLDFFELVEDFYNFKNKTIYWWFNYMLKHTIHHRGQLSVYLRLSGMKVPQIYGNTLDFPEY